MQYRAFISYSHDDAGFVDRLVNDLEHNAVNVWIDIKEISPGESITKSIEGALTNCTAILLVLSKTSVQSSWVQREYRAAIALQRGDENQHPIVIPVLVEECAVPVFLQDILWADFREGYAAGFAAVCKALRLSEFKVPSVDFQNDLEELLRQVQKDCEVLMNAIGEIPVPSYELFDMWGAHEEELRRMRVVENTALRAKSMDSKRWELIGYEPGKDGRIPLDTEAYSMKSFVLHVFAIVRNVAQLAERFGVDSQLPMKIKELWSKSGLIAGN